MGMYSETVQYVQCVTVYSTYCGVTQVLVKYVFSTYLYRKYSWSTSRSSSGNTKIVISVSFTYPSLTATHIVWLSKISYSPIPYTVITSVRPKINFDFTRSSVPFLFTTTSYWFKLTNNYHHQQLH